MLFLFGEIRRIEEHDEHIQRDRPHDQHEEFVEAPGQVGISFERDPSLQNEEQQRARGEDNVHLVHRIFLAAVKRATRAGEQIRDAKAVTIDMSVTMNSKLLIKFCALRMTR